MIKVQSVIIRSRLIGFFCFVVEYKTLNFFRPKFYKMAWFIYKQDFQETSKVNFPSQGFCHLHSVNGNFPSAFHSCHPRFSILILSSAFFYPPSGPQFTETSRLFVIKHDAREISQHHVLKVSVLVSLSQRQAAPLYHRIREQEDKRIPKVS